MGGFLLYTQEGRINLKGLSGINDTGADFFGSRKYLNTIDLIRKYLNHYETPQNNIKMEVPQSAIMSRHTNRSARWPAGYTGNFYTEYGILNEGYGTILPYSPV